MARALQDPSQTPREVRRAGSRTGRVCAAAARDLRSTVCANGGSAAVDSKHTDSRPLPRSGSRFLWFFCCRSITVLPPSQRAVSHYDRFSISFSLKVGLALFVSSLNNFQSS